MTKAKCSKQQANKGRQNATQEEVNQAINEIEKRIQEITRNMTEWEKKKTTYAVAKVKLPDGTYEIWVASAGQEGYVRPDIRTDSKGIENKVIKIRLIMQQKKIDLMMQNKH